MRMKRLYVPPKLKVLRRSVPIGKRGTKGKFVGGKGVLRIM